MTPRPAARSDTDGDDGLDENCPPARSRPGAIPRRTYLLFMVRGAVALAFGVTLLAAGANLSRLTTFVAVYWIVAALLTLNWVGTRRALPHRRLALAAGLTGLVAGVALVFRELFKALLGEGLFLDFLGATAIATGVLRLSGLIHDDQLSHNAPRRRYRFVVGTLELLLGVALVTAEGGSAHGTRILLGLWGLAMGAFLLLDGFMVRRLATDAGRAK
jgi:uncharacterized membrane protein HdeD (DUF308 family)